LQKTDSVIAAQGAVMAKATSLSARTTTSARRDGHSRATASSRRDGDGNQVYNEILLALPRAESEAVFPKLEFMRLKLHHVLHEAGETLRSLYFCNSGMFSILNVMPDGKSVEVGLIGKEGVSGTPLVAGFRTSHTRAVIQAEATAFRMDADALRSALPKCPTLDRQLNRYAQLLAVQVTQIAACNRLHEVNERLARWLLMTQDRVGSEHLPLTQEFLAQMLGTRRSSVTVSAGTLQKAGLIAYTRGNVTIHDRRKLEEAACDCYGLLQRQVTEWQSQNS
jgi:CRP-like cAMP-binding protein